MDTLIQSEAEEDGAGDNAAKRDKPWVVWKRADALAVFERWKTSGLSLRQFAKQEGFSHNKLYSWKRKLFSSDPLYSSAVKMLPVKIVGTKGSGRSEQTQAAGSFSEVSQADVMEVICHNGWLVRVRPGFDAASLNKLLGLLDTNRPC